MKKVSRKKIEVVYWENRNAKKCKSEINGFITIRPHYDKYTKFIEKQIKFLEYSSKFHKEIERLREKYKYSSKLPKISEKEKLNRDFILRNWNSLPPSMKVDTDGVKLTKEYMEGQLPLSFSTYLAYDFFPIEKELLGISFLKKKIPKNNVCLINIDKKMGIDEFIKQARILFPLIKDDINKLRSENFYRDRGTFNRNLRIIELLHLGWSLKKINSELRKTKKDLEPESLRVTVSNLLKRVS